MKKFRKFLRPSHIAFFVLFALSVSLNLAAWGSRAFSDWYAETLFPVLSAPLSRFTNLLPFSLGEWLLLALVVWIIALLLSFLFVAALHILKRAGSAGGKIICTFFQHFLYVSIWLLDLVFLIMTLNCLILYHTTPIEEELPGAGKEYTIADLSDLRDYVVEKCNELAKTMPRDENGDVYYEGGYSAMAQQARNATASLSEHTDDLSLASRLSGWQTTPKPLYFSDFVSQQYIQGYYFPFSMEANYNTVMKVMNAPFTMCHELSHTHGFIYEDEANLLGFLSCIYSEDPVFVYSGWLSILNYVNNSFFENVDEETYAAHVSVSKLVRFDNQFLSDEAWKAVEEDALLSTQTVKAATDTYLDTTLKVNGVESGKASYSHVVELLLQYFDGDFDR